MHQIITRFREHLCDGVVRMSKTHLLKYSLPYSAIRNDRMRTYFVLFLAGFVFATTSVGTKHIYYFPVHTQCETERYGFTKKNENPESNLGAYTFFRLHKCTQLLKTNYFWVYCFQQNKDIQYVYTPSLSHIQYGKKWETKAKFIDLVLLFSSLIVYLGAFSRKSLNAPNLLSQRSNDRYIFLFECSFQR